MTPDEHIAWTRAAAGGGPGGPTVPVLPPATPLHLHCLRRGGKVRSLNQGCGACTVWACAKHGECVLTQSVQSAGLHACPTCPDYIDRIADPSAITLNMGAGGLGDAILGLFAVGGVKRANPAATVVYRVGSRGRDFVRLFGGYDELIEHVHDKGGREKPGGPDRQLNDGYMEVEMAGRGAETRVGRYCRNAGVEPVFPALRDADRLRELGRPFAGCVVLAPVTAGSDREWSVPHWRALERLLRAAGFRTVVPHKDVVRTDWNVRDRLRGFQSELLLDRPAEEVAGVILNAAVFIGCDSGLSHLAGALGTPAVVLCGQVDGDTVYNPYPSVRVVHGPLGCHGCFWQPAGGWNGRACAPACPNVQAITPELVLAVVREVCRNG